MAGLVGAGLPAIEGPTGIDGSLCQRRIAGKPAPTVAYDAKFDMRLPTRHRRMVKQYMCLLAANRKTAFCDPRAHKVLKEIWHSTHAPLATRNAQRKTSWPKVKFAATKRRRSRRATKCQAQVRRPPRVDCHQSNCRAVRASFLVALLMRQQCLPYAVHGSTSSPRTVVSAAFRAELDEASPRTVASAAFRAELDEASRRTGTGHILLTECHCMRPKTSRSCAAHVFSSRAM